MQGQILEPLEIICKKRDGQSLSQEEIDFFISRYTNNLIPDYQVASFLMAIYLQGLSKEELFYLTNAMLCSGKTFDLAGIMGPKIDKHSTGGVGDKISLPLAPAVAALGVYVPMMSGRGLGHTGGTLDKLESIPGFRVRLSFDEFVDCLLKNHMAMIGQTEEVAPADKKMYALRDVTGTVESLPLIASSIMSKKLAEGMDGLVLDVKVGKGALMKTLPEAKRLALAMIDIGTKAGKKVSAFLTNMDEPLGRFVGNAAEINESLDVLLGQKVPDVYELTCALGGEMLRLAGKVKDLEEGKSQIAQVLSNGRAYAQMNQCVVSQSGAFTLYGEDFSHWKLTNLHEEVQYIYAPKSGYVTSVDAYKVGIAGVAMGIGRMQKEDDVDPAAFIYLNKKTGEWVNQGEILCTYAVAKDLPQERRLRSQYLLENAYEQGEKAPSPKTLIYEVIQ